VQTTPEAWKVQENEERRKRKNVRREVERSSYRREKNEMKGGRDKAKRKYVEGICELIMEFHRTGLHYLMCTKKKQLGWKENHVIQTNGIEDT